MTEPLAKCLMNYGPFHRIWPTTDDCGNVYASVSVIRSFAEPVCKLFKSKDSGATWIELADFLSMDPKNSTTGQPCILNDGTILVPVWDAGFYEFGRSWLTVYRSHDDGLSWQQVYSDPAATYGKHFFLSDSGEDVYLCAGIGGGGYNGKVGFTPARGLLLRSNDYGNHWDACVEVAVPTSLYDGISIDGVLFISAREKGAVLSSKDSGETWSEVQLGMRARNVSEVQGKIVVSSDGAIFVSNDQGVTWVKRSSPFKNLVLRYPIAFRDKIIMTAVGWRSLILATRLEQNEWRIAFDAARVVHSDFMTRLATTKDFLFIGDEIENGLLLRIPTSALGYARTFPYLLLDLLGQKKMLRRFSKPSH